MQKSILELILLKNIFLYLCQFCFCFCYVDVRPPGGRNCSRGEGALEQASLQLEACHGRLAAARGQAAAAEEVVSERCFFMFDFFTNMFDKI